MSKDNILQFDLITIANKMCLLKKEGATRAEIEAQIDTTSDPRLRKELDNLFPTLKDQVAATLKQSAKSMALSANLAILEIHAFKNVRVFADESGATTQFSINADNIAKMQTVDQLCALAVAPLQQEGKVLSNLEMKSLVQTWIMREPRVEKLPPSFSTHPTELTFNRINLALNESPTPTWDYFISKCGPNGKSLMAFVWSILDRSDKSQQYLFLKGQGGDGKGALTRWLNSLLNDQQAGLSASDPRWPVMCVGKRLGVFNDINSTAIILSSNFKQATGGDKVTVDQKNVSAFAVTLDTKFILTTNQSISVLNSSSERRRAIFVELQPNDQRIAGYEENLLAETQGFLFNCQQAYADLYDQDRKQIVCDYSFFESEAANFEESNEYFLDRGFIVEADATTSAADFQATMRSLKADNNQVGNFKDWLKRTHGVEKKNLTVDGKRSWFYVGIKAIDPVSAALQAGGK